jgi:hypothetical protein
MEKLALIVPYRDREQHLKEFVPFMEKYLAEEEIDFNIFIIEQFDAKPFNRAKLLNIGYLESSNYDYFAFHDIDMIPIDSDYSYPEGPTHLASEVEQFNWGLPYEGYFGGVTIFDKESFLSVNGYSNEYWGWGAEDDDMIHRCMVMDIDTYRKQCRYRSLDHKRIIERSLYNTNLLKLEKFQNSDISKDIIANDGISCLIYQKISDKMISNNTKHIQVKI